MNYRDVDVDANAVIQQLSAKVGELETTVMLKNSQIDILARLCEQRDKELESLREIVNARNLDEPVQE